MSTSTALHPSVRAALEALVDYAGLFPPAALEMPQAIEEYLGARSGQHAWMLGRFIVPASRIGEMGGRERELPLSAIVGVQTRDAGEETTRWFDRVRETLAGAARMRDAGTRIEALEVRLPPLRSERETHDAAMGQLGAMLAQHGLRGIPAYAELPRDARWSDVLPGAMTAAVRARLGVKLRCGGLTPGDFPTTEQVAAFIGAAASENVPFKATAGLHHPVRHYDETVGCRMHGFLNLLAAAALATRVDPATLESIVAEEDPKAFTFDPTALRWRDEVVSAAELADVRSQRFVAYGSCSFAEPVEDLTALGILAPAP